MANLARVRFHSERFPEGDGELVLSEGGWLHVAIGEAMLERIAAREAQIVERSARVSRVSAAGFVALAIASLAAGWLAGRLGGRLRERWTEARSISETCVEYDPAVGLSVSFEENRLHRAMLAWNPGEYDPDEAQRFYEEAQRLQRQSKPERRK